MNLPAAVLTCLVLFAPFTQAATIYQWVDDQGRVQFSDKVPERYKSQAKEVEVERFKPAPSVQKRAAPNVGVEPPKTPADGLEGSALPPGVSALPRPPQPAPGAARAKETDCATLRRRYADSQRCFAPFVTATGGLKAEAFTTCTPVADPSAQCGIPSLP